MAVPARLRWHFAPIEPALQQAVQQVAWDDLAGCPAAQRVKVAENRDVWRIDLPGKTIYAKCYRSHGLIKGALESVRGLAAKREWRALRQASRLGVQAPDPLGYARATSLHKDQYYAILVTAAMPADALSLEEAWLRVAPGDMPAGADPAESRQRKCRLLHALAELIAKAHAGGLFHRDLHVGNILIFQNGHGPTAAMIDLHNAQLAGGLSIRGVRSNLVQLNQWFARHASRTDRMRFLKMYCRMLREHLGTAQYAAEMYGHKAFAQHVLQQSCRYAGRLYRKRDRRILKKNKYFTTLSLQGGWSARLALEIKHGRPYAHALSQLPTKGQWRELLGDPAGLLNALDGRVLKQSSTRTVVQTDLRLGGAAWTAIAKHEHGHSLRQRLGQWLGRDPLKCEFVTGWKCLHRELPVALPLGILTRRSGGRQESILLVEYLPESRDLDTFTKMQLPELPAGQALRAKRRICSELAATLRRMYGCGMAHRDLKAANIRVQVPGGDLEKLKIVLVDLDGIRTPRWSVRKALLRSLARLDASFSHCPSVTRTDRLRLLLAVLRGIDPGRPRWRSAWRQIARLSQRDQATIARTLPWLQPIAGAAGAQ